MEKVYLTYEDRLPDGVLPNAAEIYACIKFLTRTEQGKFRSEDAVNTSKSPREILRELEELIKVETGERPNLFDPLYILKEDDESPEEINSVRFICYLARGSWPKIGQSQEEAIKEASEYNSQRNKKIYSAYRQYVDRLNGEK